MRPELEAKLAADFPFMADVVCEHGDGWYDVIRGLCSEIEKLFAATGVPVDVQPFQVKEKYGMLRFYYGTSVLSDEVSAIVAKWEELSGMTCEQCGKDGAVRDVGGWMTTLCEECFGALGKS